VAVVAAVATPFAWHRPATRVETVGGAPPGRQLFEAKGCVGCHRGPDVGEDRGFPDLSDAPAWAGARRRGYSAADYLAESIRDPGAFESPQRHPEMVTMPYLGLTDAEVAAVVAYLLHER
jgi:mono/diheme cytochrome c family protein